MTKNKREKLVLKCTYLIKSYFQTEDLEEFQNFLDHNNINELLTSNGENLLHRCFNAKYGAQAYYKVTKLANFLIENGVDTEALDKNGNTPYDAAKKRKNTHLDQFIRLKHKEKQIENQRYLSKKLETKQKEEQSKYHLELFQENAKLTHKVDALRDQLFYLRKENKKLKEQLGKTPNHSQEDLWSFTPKNQLEFIDFFPNHDSTNSFDEINLSFEPLFTDHDN
ncbi:MAG: hypothetical protein DGJ47_001042 [Rickettsiaceae bacterium]